MNNSIIVWEIDRPIPNINEVFGLENKISLNKLIEKVMIWVSVIILREINEYKKKLFWFSKKY